MLSVAAETVYKYSMPAQPVPPSRSDATAATLVYVPAPLKGRGTAWAIEHRFNSQTRESLDDGWGLLEQAAREEIEGRPNPATQILEERASLAALRGDHGKAAEELRRAHARYVEIGASKHAERLAAGNPSL